MNGCVVKLRSLLGRRSPAERRGLLLGPTIKVSLANPPGSRLPGARGPLATGSHTTPCDFSQRRSREGQRRSGGLGLASGWRGGGSLRVRVRKEEGRLRLAPIIWQTPWLLSPLPPSSLGGSLALSVCFLFCRLWWDPSMTGLTFLVLLPSSMSPRCLS